MRAACTHLDQDRTYCDECTKSQEGWIKAALAMEDNSRPIAGMLIMPQVSIALSKNGKQACFWKSGTCLRQLRSTWVADLGTVLSTVLGMLQP